MNSLRSGDARTAAAEDETAIAHADRKLSLHNPRARAHFIR